MIRRWGGWLAALALSLALLAAIGWWWRRDAGPDPQTVATASLQSLREQNRLTPFAARFTAVVTAEQTRFGLTARKTLILPGLVRYEVDLARLTDRDLAWDAAARTLSVVLPPLEVVGPEIDLTRMREYDAGGLLMRLTDAETALDAANRRAGARELLAQAREPVTMNLARDAARRAIERNFALPLRAAGLDATVRVRFADEPGFRQPVREEWDRSRAAKDVLANGP